MVDKNGKLFGKINLIDLIIVIILVAVVAFVALRVTGIVGGSGGGETVPVRITFYGAEVPDFVLDYIIPGESVYDHAEEVTMGVVEGYETAEPVGYESVLGGEVQEVTRAGHSSVTLTITGEAVLTENGAVISGELYGVGHTLSIYAGKAKMYLKVSGIEAIG